MGYLHIDNLYKYPDILLFKQVYALEKIHGTSAHVGWKNGELSFFSGGEKHEHFVSIFDAEALRAKFVQLNEPEIIVHGEAYGGRCQGMSDVYGTELKFVAFDVKIGESWLNVPNAEAVAKELGFEFVSYVQCSTDLDELNKWRDAPSVQAMRNGRGAEQKREGVVLRPLIELRKNNGERIIAKHKAEEFRETATKRELGDAVRLSVLADAVKVADEWVTPMRLEHVVDKLPCDPDQSKYDVRRTGEIVKLMIDDVQRESAGEVVWSKDVAKAVGGAAAKLYKRRATMIENKEEKKCTTSSTCSESSPGSSQDSASASSTDCTPK